MRTFVTILLGFIGAFYYGWVAHLLWGWFLVPLGVPAVGWMQATGIGVLLGMLHTRGSYSDLFLAFRHEKEKPNDHLSIMILLLFMTPSISLVFGVILKALMTVRFG